MDFNKLEIGKCYYTSLFTGCDVVCINIDKQEKEAVFKGKIYAGSSESRVTLNDYEVKLHIY